MKGEQLARVRKFHPDDGTPHCRVCGFCGVLSMVATGQGAYEYEHPDLKDCVEAMHYEYGAALDAAWAVGDQYRKMVRAHSYEQERKEDLET